MTVERYLRIIAGAFIVLTVLLFNGQTQANIFDQANWLWFTLFVGVNLFQSGFSNWCLMSSLLKMLGVKETQQSC